MAASVTLAAGAIERVSDVECSASRDVRWAYLRRRLARIWRRYALSRPPLGWLRRLALTLGIALTIHLIAVFTVPTFAIAYDDRWRGLATHSNAFGALAFLSLWANCASLLLEKKDPWPRALFIAAAVLALYGAQSATSTISALASFVALLLLIAPKAKRLWRSMLRAIILAVPVVVLCIYALFDVLLEILGPMIGRSADMTGRLALWATAIDLVSLKPILGWGFDNNAAVILETGLPTVHFHNGVLDLAVRGGVVSVTLFGSGADWGIQACKSRWVHACRGDSAICSWVHAPQFGRSQFYGAAECSLAAFPRNDIYVDTSPTGTTAKHQKAGDAYAWGPKELIF